MPHPDDYDNDRRDDRYDDGPRDGYDDYERRDDGRGGRVARARERVSLPAIFLMIVGLICLAWNVMAIALLWMAPDMVVKGKYDLMKDMFPNQPLPAYEEYVKQEQVQQSVMYSIRTVIAVLIVVGAMKMKAVQGYGLAMTSAILSVIPFCPNECCCTLPFGIWALIVLLNADVKRAFSLSASTLTRPESY
jgi:hypothetical protein